MWLLHGADRPHRLSWPGAVPLCCGRASRRVAQSEAFRLEIRTEKLSSAQGDNGGAYGYAKGNPRNVKDPSGTCWFCISTITKSGIGLGVVALAASGVGLVADAGLLGAEATALGSTAAAIGTAAGAGASLADLVPCVTNGSVGACVGAAAGGLGAALGGGVLLAGGEDVARGLLGAGGFAIGADAVTWGRWLRRRRAHLEWRPLCPMTTAMPVNSNAG